MLLSSLRAELKLTEDGVNKKLRSLRKQRGFDITRKQAALLLASLNDIDISKFANEVELKETRELKNKEYNFEKIKTKEIEVSRTLKIKDITITSKEPHTPKKLISDAKKMSEYYSLLYVLENTLRNLIRYVFRNEKKYWKTKVNERIRTDVKFIMSKERYYEEGRADELEYAHLDHLKQIIASNWGEFSKEIKENNKGNFMREIEKFTPSRHGIAHTTLLKGLDADRCRYKFEEIIKMI